MIDTTMTVEPFQQILGSVMGFWQSCALAVASRVELRWML